MSFNFIRDQDKTIVIEVQVPRATRAAFRFPRNLPTEQIIISENLLKFEGLSVRKLDTGVRLSFKTDPKYSYAYYKITTRMLALGAGVSVGAIAGIAASIYLAPAIATGLGLIGAASTTSAFTIGASATLVSATSTAGLVTGYLVGKQMPKYIYSRDPRVSQFYQEIVIHNQTVFEDSSQQFAFWSVDDGDPRDIYRFFKTSKAVVEKLPGILNNLADSTGDAADVLAQLAKVAPWLIGAYFGLKAYNNYKGQKV